MALVRDEAMIQLIKAKLGADLRTGGQTIEARVADGEVVLIGYTDSEEQRSVAEMIVAGTCGTHRVVNTIQVRRLRQAI